ncbi:hypothetical protein K439DRAFT_1643569 [Ramaria rubella]|nr:hypothetical protein K439DRAFT_1643569 [Ramaria rubella]
MVCLNLPPEISGIINGPGEPHLTDLNHYMRPLVDDMELSWDRGVHFSKTAMFPTGHMIRSAIAAVVCSLPAARKAAQLSSHCSHFYCSVCQCVHKTTRGRTDFDVWERHDVAVLRQYAMRWRSAPTAKDQDRLFAAHGVCWSELWRLPYWDPTRQLVVDSMHCILERLVQCHICDILDLSTRSATTKPVTQSAFSFNFQQAHSDHNMADKEVKQVAQIHTLLMAPIYDEIDEEIQNQLEVLKGKLLQKTLKPLKFVCNDLGCPLGSKRLYKSDYIKALIQWWVGRPMTVMLHIRNVIKDTVILSWINSIPPNFADEWRTLSTIYLPLALISLWGAVHLVSCILSYISRYIKDLKAIHPGVEHTTRLFGPIRMSYWHIAASLEMTMLQAFIRGAKLRHRLRRPDCPPAIKEFSKLFEKAYSKGYDDLIPHNDVDNLNLYVYGVVYATSSAHLGNSLIQFYPGGRKKISYCLLGLFNIYSIIEPAIDDIVDHFKPYPHVLAKLYSSDLSEQLEIVKVNWVVGHFARWSISQNHVVVLSLSCD